ncbi:MAG: hypothetical protein J6M05_01315 [Cardiobacteriaceae bacterium]|nr:hypothetical protein [Cardiobacteriaceae bacterium]
MLIKKSIKFISIIFFIALFIYFFITPLFISNAVNNYLNSLQDREIFPQTQIKFNHQKSSLFSRKGEFIIFNPQYSYEISSGEFEISHIFPFNSKFYDKKNRINLDAKLKINAQIFLHLYAEKIALFNDINIKTTVKIFDYHAYSQASAQYENQEKIKLDLSALNTCKNVKEKPKTFTDLILNSDCKVFFTLAANFDAENRIDIQANVAENLTSSFELLKIITGKEKFNSYIKNTDIEIKLQGEKAENFVANLWQQNYLYIAYFFDYVPPPNLWQKDEQGSKSWQFKKYSRSTSK